MRVGVWKIVYKGHNMPHHITSSYALTSTRLCLASVFTAPTDSVDSTVWQLLSHPLAPFFRDKSAPAALHTPHHCLPPIRASPPPLNQSNQRRIVHASELQVDCY